MLKTASAPSALRLTPDRPAVRAEWGDLVHVMVEIVDREGAVVKYVRPEVSVDVAGVGELIALGTADPFSGEPCTGTNCNAFEGRLLAIVRCNGEAGEIRVKAGSAGLASSEISFSAG